MSSLRPLDPCSSRWIADKPPVPTSPRSRPSLPSLLSPLCPHSLLNLFVLLPLRPLRPPSSASSRRSTTTRLPPRRLQRLALIRSRLQLPRHHLNENQARDPFSSLLLVPDVAAKLKPLLQSAPALPSRLDRVAALLDLESTPTFSPSFLQHLPCAVTVMSQLFQHNSIMSLSRLSSVILHCQSRTALLPTIFNIKNSPLQRPMFFLRIFHSVINSNWNSNSPQVNWISDHRLSTPLLHQFLQRHRKTLSGTPSRFLPAQ